MQLQHKSSMKSCGLLKKLRLQICGYSVSKQHFLKKLRIFSCRCFLQVVELRLRTLKMWACPLLPVAHPIILRLFLLEQIPSMTTSPYPAYRLPFLHFAFKSNICYPSTVPNNLLPHAQYIHAQYFTVPHLNICPWHSSIKQISRHFKQNN